MADSAASGDTDSPWYGWGWLLGTGILLFAAGFLLMLHPFATSAETALMLGCAIIGGGLLSLLSGITDREGEDRWLYILLGFVGLFSGIVVLFDPFVAAVSLAWTVGAWLIAGGSLKLFLTFRLRRRRR